MRLTCDEKGGRSKLERQLTANDMVPQFFPWSFIFLTLYGTAVSDDNLAGSTEL